MPEETLEPEKTLEEENWYEKMLKEKVKKVIERVVSKGKELGLEMNESDFHVEMFEDEYYDENNELVHAGTFYIIQYKKYVDANTASKILNALMASGDADVSEFIPYDNTLASQWEFELFFNDESDLDKLEDELRHKADWVEGRTNKTYYFDVDVVKRCGRKYLWVQRVHIDRKAKYVEYDEYLRPFSW